MRVRDKESERQRDRETKLRSRVKSRNENVVIGRQNGATELLRKLSASRLFRANKSQKFCRRRALSRRPHDFSRTGTELNGTEWLLPDLVVAPTAAVTWPWPRCPTLASPVLPWPTLA